MKKLTLLLTAVSLAVGAQVAFAQQASDASSYSPPTQKHVKKAKKKKSKAAAASAPAASQ